jgi:CheY-like chemotaxis protein
MDINLGGGIDGIETMKEIRKLKGFDKVPIIAVTGYAALGDRERFLGEGFDEYLPKPFNREEMHRVLRKVLGAD